MSVEPPIGPGLLGDDLMVSTPDGRQLRTMVRGAGEDLVLLEAGLGFSGLYWGLVHERVAEHARVVAYERAGFGSSTPDDATRDLARIVIDLETVLDAHPHRRLVLVGHSWGGPIVRTLAAQRIARGLPLHGLVLVDQSDEHSPLYFTSSARRQFAAQAALMVPLARVRLLAALSRALVRGLPPALVDAVVRSSTSVEAARATASEQRQVIHGLDRLRQSPPALGDVPIAVLSGQRTGRLEAKARASIVQAHRDTVAQYPAAKFVPAERSGHMIPVSEPDLVASEALSFFH